MNNPKLTLVGRRIRVGMLSTGIDGAAELARRSQASRHAIHQLLYHESDHVDARTLLRVSDAVNLSMRWLLYGSGAPTKPAQVTPGQAHILRQYDLLSPACKSILQHCLADLMEIN